MRTRELVSNPVTTAASSFGQPKVPRRVKNKKSTYKRQTEARLVLKPIKRPRLKMTCKIS
jgi:hypothetical protein